MPSLGEKTSVKENVGEVLPPGTILQMMYLKERLKKLKPGKFIEVGCGKGLISKIFLDAGWSGIGYDLNALAIDQAIETNKKSVAEGKFAAYNKDWLLEPVTERVDLIISCFVLEHLDDTQEAQYINKCKTALNKGGHAVLFVPSSPKHWGIDDEIAGHYRRYTYRSLRDCFANKSWNCAHIAGLNYPLSNVLLPLSNKLVAGAESKKLDLSMIERTELSSTRNVAFKTEYPPSFGLLLNELTMLPFHFCQKAFTKHQDALVIYSEFEVR